VRGATWLLTAVVFGSALAGSGLAGASVDDGDATVAAPAQARPGRDTGIGPGQGLRGASLNRDVQRDRAVPDPIRGKRWSETAMIRHGRRWSLLGGPLPGKRWSETAVALQGKRWSDLG